MLVSDVTKKSYLLAPMMPAVGKLHHNTIPWSSKLRHCGISPKLSDTHDVRPGRMVDSASVERPLNSRKVDERYSSTISQALLWHSCKAIRTIIEICCWWYPLVKG